MQKLIFIFLGCLLFTSCEWYEQVDVVNVGKVKLDKLDGNNATINVDIELDNPNWYAIKVKPSKLNVYVEGEYLGKAHLLEKVKIKRKQASVYNMKVELLGDKGVLKKAMKYALKKDLTVRLEGKVKAGVFIISKKIAVDETKKIDGGIFKINIPFFN